MEHFAKTINVAPAPEKSPKIKKRRATFTANSRITLDVRKYDQSW